MAGTDTVNKMGSDSVSGKFPGVFKITHQRNPERCCAVAEKVGVIVASNLEGVTMTVHVDVDRLVFVGDFNGRAGKQVPCML